MTWVRNYLSFTMLTVISVDLLATSGDITMTWSSPMYPKLYSNDTSINPLGRPITSEEDSWLGSLINIGAMVGPLPFTFISERYGRKISLLLSAIPHVVAYTTMAFATNIYVFYFARLLGGLAVGGSYAILPLYIAEVAEVSNRGMYSVSLGFFWCLGDCLPYILGPFLSVRIFHFILTSIPVIFIVSFSLIGTETPYFLVGKKEVKKAERVLMYLRSGTEKDVEEEMKLIEETVTSEAEGKMIDILKSPGLRKALFISVSMISFQQLGGINAIAFYQQSIMESSGANMSSDTSSVIIGVSLLIFSTMPPFIVDRYGRKPLSIFSNIGVGLTLVLIGTYFFGKEQGWDLSNFNWLPLAGILLYYFFFETGVATLPWTIGSELFPKNTKKISSSAISSSCWISSFAVTRSFNGMVDALGTSGTFWFYAMICFVCAVFIVLLVPETKGKTFIEIQEKLHRKKGDKSKSGRVP